MNHFTRCKKCNNPLDEADVDYWNGCNELGEDYGVVKIYCKCGREYEANQWGEWNSKEEAIECLKEYIEEI